MSLNTELSKHNQFSSVSMNQHHNMKTIFSKLIILQMMHLKPKRKGALSTFAEPTSDQAEIKTQEIKTSSPQANTFPTRSLLSSF